MAYPARSVRTTEDGPLPPAEALKKLREGSSDDVFSSKLRRFRGFSCILGQKPWDSRPFFTLFLALATVEVGF